MTDPGVEAEATENARLLIECGYLDADSVAQAVVDMQEDPDAESDEGDDQEGLAYERARELVEGLWQERLAAQAAWPARTDPDALEAAFEALDEHGIVAREDFACCARCGHAEIRAEMDESSRGYVFFHQQRTEAAVLSGELYLNFGAREPHRAEDVALEVAERLRAEGLTVEWNGDANTAVLVRPIVWLKRIG